MSAIFFQEEQREIGTQKFPNPLTPECNVNLEDTGKGLKANTMHSKLLFIFFSQKQAPVKEDYINNSFSTKQVIDAHIKFLLNMKYENR